MCSPRKTDQQSVKKVAVNVLRPIPIDRKIKQIATNMWIRVSKLQTCCGHPGQAGC